MPIILSLDEHWALLLSSEAPHIYRMNRMTFFGKNYWLWKSFPLCHGISSTPLFWFHIFLWSALFIKFGNSFNWAHFQSKISYQTTIQSAVKYECLFRYLIYEILGELWVYFKAVTFLISRYQFARDFSSETIPSTWWPLLATDYSAANRSSAIWSHELHFPAFSTFQFHS